MTQTGKRNGQMVGITFRWNLHDAIKAEAALDPAGESFQHAVLRMCRDWLEGRTSTHPVTVAAEVTVKPGPQKSKRGRKGKT